MRSSTTRRLLLGCALVAAPAAAAIVDPTTPDAQVLILRSTSLDKTDIATCATQACADDTSTEDQGLSEMFCATATTATQVDNATQIDGCVRWWTDESSWDCTLASNYGGSCTGGKCCDSGNTHYPLGEWANGETFETGHEFGQDDLPKPTFYGNCLNGLPCVYFGSPADMNGGGNDWTSNQPAGLEIQSFDTGDATVAPPLSIMTLVKITGEPAANYCWIGTSNNCFGVVDASNSVGYDAGTGAFGAVSTSSALTNDTWHLVELYVDSSDNVTVFVDETDVTSGSPTDSDSFLWRYVGTQVANPANTASQTYMATLLFYSDALSQAEIDGLREWHHDRYDWQRKREAYSRPSRGYVARACGFDADDDGVIGEAADCNWCDGTTLDPDGDGVNEDQIYVDTATGSDTGGCGTTGSPCATVNYAMNTIADGPSDGAEDVICLKGTDSPSNVALDLPGVAGFDYTGTRAYAGWHWRSRSGSEVRPFRIPSDPAMLIGWDADNDGEYPPFDTDDTAVLSGTSPTIRAFTWPATENGPFEVAHLSVSYGNDVGTDDAGFVYFRHASNPAIIHDGPFYFHDLQLDINKSDHADGGRIIWSLFLGTSVVRNLLIENVNIVTGSYVMRGSLGFYSDSGPFRFASSTVTSLGHASTPPPGGGQEPLGFKLWSHVRGHEIIDSVFDGNLDNWAEDTAANGSWVARFGTCQQANLFRNNLVQEWNNPVHVQAYEATACDGAGDARAVDDTVVDGNEFNPGSTYTKAWFFSIEDCNDATNTAGETTVTNNLAYFPSGFASAIRDDCYNGTGANAGDLRFLHNTFASGAAPTAGMMRFTCSAANGWPNVILRNNVVDPSSGDSIQTECAVPGWDSDYNVFGTDQFEWNNVTGRTFAQWKTDTSDDAASAQCNPTYTGSTDVHLSSSDTCAANVGTDLTATYAVLTLDVDADARAASPDIGADEGVYGTVGVGLSGIGMK